MKAEDAKTADSTYENNENIDEENKISILGEEKLPTESESLIRVDRVMTTKHSHEFTDAESENIVAPFESYKTSSSFDKEESELLARLFDDMIANAPISKPTIQGILAEDDEGNFFYVPQFSQL